MTNENRERGIDRLFARLMAMYGAKFLNAWAGCDIEEVKRTWEEELLRFRDCPTAIRDAVRALDDCPWPPSLPEFVALCRASANRNRGSAPALAHVLTEEEKAHNAEQLKKIERISKEASAKSYTNWYEYPRSQIALDYAFDLAKTRPAVRQVIDGLIEQGIVSKSGRMLKRHMVEKQVAETGREIVVHKYVNL